MTLEEFYRKCDSIKPDKKGCMIWPDRRWAKLRKGSRVYISVGIGKLIKKAHRLVLERKLNRPIHYKHWALHICNNRACVNPSHIYEGTPKDNARDYRLRHPNHSKRKQVVIKETWRKWRYG